jgi:hypothetical protein
VVKRITWLDVVIAISFAIFALAFQLQRWGGYDPAIFMGSDAGVYTEIAAAEAYPHLFVGDALLQRADNYNFYKIAHIFAIRTLGWLTGDYGKGMIFLLGPLVLTHLLGYYILGRVLYQNRFWAIILSLTTAVYISPPVSDDVGLLFDPIPGLAFGALLPYLLAAIIRFQDETDKWKIIMACCAGMIYIHPVSAPAWVFGLWLFYAFSNPDGLLAGQRIKRAIVLGMVAFLLALPFAVVYVGAHDTAPSDPVKVAAIRDAMEARIEPAYLNPISTIGVFFKWLLTDFRYTYFALLSLTVLLYDNRYQRKVRALVLLILGVVGFSIIFPSIEYLRTVYTGIPYQTEFIRPLKYVIPVIFVLSVWGLRALHARLALFGTTASIVSVLIGLLFVAYIHRKNPNVVDSIYPPIQAWFHGDFLPKKAKKNLLEVEAIRAVRQFTPEKSKLFVTSDRALEVRYAALRPVVFAYKDGSTFAFSNYSALLKWHDVYKKVGGRFKKTGYSPAELEQTMIPLARELDAEYILVFFGDYFEKLGSNIVSRNSMVAPKITQIATPAVFNGLKPIASLERNKEPYDLHLYGVSHIWSNRQYGLYRLIG